MNAFLAWTSQFPTVSLMVIFQLVDIALALMVAWSLQTISSDISGKGMRKKATMLLIVLVAAACERYLDFYPYPYLASGVAAYFCGTEMISIAENAGALGVPLPPQLMAVLAQLRPDEKQLGAAQRPDVVEQALDVVTGEEREQHG